MIDRAAIAILLDGKPTWRAASAKDRETFTAREAEKHFAASQLICAWHRYAAYKINVDTLKSCVNIAPSNH